MSNDKVKMALIGTLVGASLGLVVALIISESKQKEFEMITSGGGEAHIKPGMRETIAFVAATVALVRQLQNMLEHKE